MEGDIGWLVLLEDRYVVHDMPGYSQEVKNNRGEDTMKRLISVLMFVVTFLSASELDQMHKACERQMALACYELGFIYADQDRQKALYYWQQSCQYGYQQACKDVEKHSR